MTPSVLSPRPARRTHRRVLLAALVLVLLAAGGFVGWLFYKDAAHERLLREALAETEALDPHWRIDALEARRAVIPGTENSAPLIQRIRAGLDRPRQNVFGQRDEAARDLAPQVRLTDEQYQVLIDWLEQVEPAIRPTLALARHPRGRHPITYTPDLISTLLRHVDDMTMIEWQVLQPLHLVLVHEGDLAEAVRACQAQLNLGRSIGDEPFFVSQLVRIRYGREAVRGLERVLGHGEVAEDVLASFQRALAEEVAFDPWPVAARGERAVVH